MSEELLSVNQIQMLISNYYNKERMDWDAFDQILMQLTMLAMSGQIKFIKELDGYDRILKDFKRRAERKEFPNIKYIIFAHFGALIAQDEELTDHLLRYGCDVLFPRLNWVDRVSVLDMADKLVLPYAEKIYLKVAIEILRDSY